MHEDWSPKTGRSHWKSCFCCCSGSGEGLEDVFHGYGSRMLKARDRQLCLAACEWYRYDSMCARGRFPTRSVGTTEVIPGEGLKGDYVVIVDRFKILHVQEKSCVVVYQGSPHAP